VRCATDNVNGDNVEYIFFPSGTNHVFCYAYYVSPPPTSGTIIIHKTVIGAPTGTNPAFAFSRDPGDNLSYDPNGFTLKNGDSSTFYRAGGQTWRVTEDSVAGYTLTSVTCNPTAGTSTSGSTLSIALTAGETANCTFVNTFGEPPNGTLTVIKVTEGGSGGPFEFTAAGPGTPTLLHATTTAPGVPATEGPKALPTGTYTISEDDRPLSPLGHWELVDAVCGLARSAGEVSVDITSRGPTVCTFTNRLVPAGAIALSKVTKGGTGTAAFVIESTRGEIVQYHQDATTTKPGVPVDASPDNSTDATDHIPWGTYRIIEQPPLSTGSGTWVLTSVQCNGVDAPFSQGAAIVKLTRQDPHANCRFTNTLTHGSTVDPETNEPGVPLPGEPAGPGNVWANLAVSSQPNPKLAQSGQQIHDTIMVTNHGPSDAESVILDVQTPTGAKLISVHTPQGRCSGTLPLTCKLGTLKPDGKVTLTVVIVPGQASGVFKMRDVVGSSTYDPELSNNSRIELADIAAALPVPPTPPVACPSRATPIAHAAC
jgi:hypothetical protein